MMKKADKIVFRISELENKIGRIVPANAMIDITNMLYHAGIKKIDIVLSDYEAVIIDDESPEAIEINHSKENVILDLCYDIKVYRHDGIRRAVTKTKLLFKGNDGSVYRITLENMVEVKTLSREYDDLMFSCCYLYAKEMLSYLPLDMYTNEDIKLPDSYKDFCEVNKSYYDGYTIDLVNSANATDVSVDDLVAATAEEGVKVK